jgi:hypothetical protein
MFGLFWVTVGGEGGYLGIVGIEGGELGVEDESWWRVEKMDYPIPRKIAKNSRFGGTKGQCSPVDAYVDTEEVSPVVWI